MPLPLAGQSLPPGARRSGPRDSRIEPSEPDGELVRRARRGDRWAEEALYHRHVRAVTRVAIRLLARIEEAEDVVQDAFAIALRDLGKLRDEDAFRSWVMTITVHQVRRRFRRRRLLRAMGLDRGEDDAKLAAQVDLAASPEVRVALAEIDRLLDGLPTECRIAWVLRHVEGHELRDVAVSCGCSLATAKRWIGRAQRTIAERVSFVTEDRDDG
jgi:RNA polymerase sigma-70 factor, ECF subfamily